MKAVWIRFLKAVWSFLTARLKGRVHADASRVRRSRRVSPARSFVRVMVRGGRSTRTPHPFTPSQRVRAITRSPVLGQALREVLDRRINDLRGENPRRTLRIGRSREGRAQVRAQNLSVLEAERTRQIFRACDRAINALCIGHGHSMNVRSFAVKSTCLSFACVRSFALMIANVLYPCATTPPATPLRVDLRRASGFVRAERASRMSLAQFRATSRRAYA